MVPGSQEVPSAPSRDLTLVQQGTANHLVGLVEHLDESGVNCPRAARFGYAGEPIYPMEDLCAEKILAAWPKEGQAAVQDAIRFVPEEAPEPCLMSSSFTGVARRAAKFKSEGH